MIDMWTELARDAVAWLWAPVWVWTVVTAGGLLALRLTCRRTHPLFGYRLRQALLFSLPVAVLARPWIDALRRSSHLEGLVLALPAPVPPGAGQGPATIAGLAPLQTGLAAVGDALAWGWALAATLAATIVAFRMMALARSLLEVRRLDRALEPLLDPLLLRAAEEVKGRQSVRRAVRFRVGPSCTVPMTFGWRRPIVAIPPELCEPTRHFRLAVAHELVHVRRMDYAWGLAEQAVIAAFAFHPLVWVLARSVERAREASCDSEVLDSGAGDPRSYGELLLSLSSRGVPAPLLAAGAAPRHSDLKRRLETMTRFIDAPRSRSRALRSAAAALTLALSVGLAGACADHTPPPTDEQLAALDAAEELTSRFGPLAEETRTEALRRLEVQMDYLLERIEDLRSTLQAREEAGEGHLDHLYEQAQLLNEMYLQRLETFETLRLEAETARRLAGR